MLEHKIEALTSAVNELIATLKKQGLPAADAAATVQEAAQKPAAKDKPAKDKPAAGKAAAEGKTAAQAEEALFGHVNKAEAETADSTRAAAEFEAAAAAKKAEAEAAGTLTYEQVRDAVLTVSRTLGREKAVALLARFGATGVSGVDKAHYADLYRMAQATLSGETDPEAACEDLA